MLGLSLNKPHPNHNCGNATSLATLIYFGRVGQDKNRVTFLLKDAIPGVVSTTPCATKTTRFKTKISCVFTSWTLLQEALTCIFLSLIEVSIVNRANTHESSSARFLYYSVASSNDTANYIAKLRFTGYHDRTRISRSDDNVLWAESVNIFSIEGCL